jgi:hypothetical protein
MMARLPDPDIENLMAPQGVLSNKSAMDTSDPNDPDEFSAEELEFGDIKPSEPCQKKSALAKRQDQIHAVSELGDLCYEYFLVSQVASRVCSIIQFIANRRVNGLQLYS